MNKRWVLGSLLAALLLLVGAYSVPHSFSISVTWNSFQRFTASLDYDFDPSVVQGFNGTVWAFWERAPFSAPWAEDIVYQTTNNLQPTLNASAWSPMRVLVSNPAGDVAPSAAQLKNGTLFLSFASNRTGNFDIFLKRYNPASGWSPDAQVTTNPANDVVSSLVAARDGSLWLFWDRQSSTAVNIFYKVYSNGAWSAETALTNDLLPVQNMQPSAFQLSDGRIFVAWSQIQDQHFGKVHILYKTFNGSTWSASVQLTSSSPDRHPAVTQDANNTIWISWTREIQITSTTFEDDLVYVTSTNGGGSWSPEVMLTNDQGCVDPNCPDDIQPSMSQLKDGRIWVFWASTRDPDSFWDIYYVASSPLPIHNLAVTSLGASPLKLRASGTVSVSVTATNLGTYTESFQLNLVATNKTTITIATKNVTLAANTSTSLTFTWKTGSAPPGKYKITATIPPVLGEGITGDNTLTFGTVWLVPAGDVNMDGRVDIIDAALAAFSFGATPGSTNWNPSADINGDGIINILDVAIVAFWFGTAT